MKLRIFILNILFFTSVHTLCIEAKLSEHIKTFPAFLEKVRGSCSWIWALPSWCRSMAGSLGGLFSSYEVSQEDISKLQPFFDNVEEQQTALEKLNHKENIKYIETIAHEFKEQDNKTCKQLQSIIRVHSNKRLADQKQNELSQLYYQCMGCNLFVIHIAEQEQWCKN